MAMNGRDRADDRGRGATTRAPSASRVTLNWQAVPFTCRRKEESKWTREKNGRWVLRTSNGRGKVTYWRAPRPRPRQHRRARRRHNKEVVAQQAHDNTPPADLSQAHAAIQALQAALRASWAREEQLQSKLRQSADRVNNMIPAQPGDAELDRNEEAESGFTGVTRNKAGWAAHTKRKRGVRKHLGTHDTPVEAARARRDYYSEFVAAVHQVPQGLSAVVHAVPQWIAYTQLLPQQPPRLTRYVDHPILIMLDTLLWATIILFRTDV